MTGNTITVRGSQVVPGRLIVNQNYDPRWRTDNGRLVDASGLLGIELDSLGPFEVHLRYRDWQFLVGLLISAFSAAAALWIALRKPRRTNSEEEMAAGAWLP